MKKILSYIYFLFCKIFFKVYCPLTVTGRENLPKDSFILCSNHSSHMDTPILMLATGVSFNQFGLVAAKDYFFDNPWRKIIVTVLMNLIPIDRKVSRSSLMKNISACKYFVENQGQHLIIYPEGTRSINGEIQPFKRGSAMIAQKLSMPIIPVYIDGTYESMRKGRFLPKIRKINVKIGEAILSGTDKTKLTEQLEQKIQNLKNGC